MFRHFLRTEFSEENLDFWLAVERFKRTHPFSKMAASAVKIYDEFISTNAARQVTSLSVCPLIGPTSGHVTQLLSVTGQRGLVCEAVDQSEPASRCLSQLLSASPGSDFQSHGDRQLPTIPQVPSLRPAGQSQHRHSLRSSQSEQICQPIMRGGGKSS